MKRIYSFLIKKIRSDLGTVFWVCVTLGFCFLALAVLWFNDLLMAYHTNLSPQTGITRWDHIDMVITVLFFITVLSLFPLLIYLAFMIEGKEYTRTRILMQLQREKLISKINEQEVSESFEAAYNPRKYPLPVVLVTVAVMLGWAFFFFSRGPEVILSLAGSRNLTVFLAGINTLHPVVFGFLGAFFFSLQTLVRRYFTCDLKPSVFMQLAVRIWIVMILSLILSVIWSVVENNGQVYSSLPSLVGSTNQVNSPYLIAVCFIAGIVPEVALDIIQKLVKWPFNHMSVTKDVDPSLTRLQGLNLWHQSRLAEEGIDNVQNMAESDICDLIVNTHLGASRLLDWKDQALLYIHTGDDFDEYQKAGIHTATEFVAVYQAGLDPNQPVRGSLEKISPYRMFCHWITINDDANYRSLKEILSKKTDA